jgi:hypothetical protein
MQIVICGEMFRPGIDQLLGENLYRFVEESFAGGGFMSMRKLSKLVEREPS